MVYHPKMAEFDRKLKTIFDEIDDYLEDKYGVMYKLHPARLERGMAANKEHDGLFNVGSSFTTGYGSKLGRGYAVEIRLVTLEKIDQQSRLMIEDDAIEVLKNKLKDFFSERKLFVSRDDNVIKIYGDLGLGLLNN